MKVMKAIWLMAHQCGERKACERNTISSYNNVIINENIQCENNLG
jgi:hypothetical protein